jgi:cytoskeletal protein CcmA (bactofilin family)
MRGNIETPVLMVEKGVIYEGQTKMEGVEKAPAGPGPKPTLTPVSTPPAR